MYLSLSEENHFQLFQRLQEHNSMTDDINVNRTTKKGLPMRYLASLRKIWTGRPEDRKTCRKRPEEIAQWYKMVEGYQKSWIFQRFLTIVFYLLRYHAGYKGDAKCAYMYIRTMYPGHACIGVGAYFRTRHVEPIFSVVVWFLPCTLTLSAHYSYGT